MANPASSQRPDGTKKNELNDAVKEESNLSGLKHALHGASFQLKLGIVVCLANTKKSLDPANNFSFTVAAEDPTAGKFDDIVYTFQDGEKAGILKIQVKHKLGSPVPKLTVKDFTTNNDAKNPFAILKYFASFCDQEPASTALEGYVICTNADINDKAKNLWRTVEEAVTNDSAPSLDAYVSSLFDSIRAKYYQLDYAKLWDANGTFSNLYQLLRKCSKQARLVKLLIEATKSNKRITSYNTLFKEYRQAILGALDRNETSTNDSYGFAKEFLVLSSSNSQPGYKAFRKEFEEQYRQEFNIKGCVWDDLKLKRVYVSKDYLSDEKNKYSSSDSFPYEDVDESFKSFCERLRLVCGTVGEHELDEAITKLWRNLHNDDNHLVPGQGYNEGHIATERLFKTNFDWLMDPFAKPLRSDDIHKDLENIKGTIAHMKLESMSDKLRNKVLWSPFRINAKTLEKSDLHEQIDSESFVAVEGFDNQFLITVLLDILELQGKDHNSTLFVDDFDFTSNLDTVEAVFRCNEPSRCLVIICSEAFKTVQSIVRKWKKDLLKGTTKQVFLIRKTDNTSSELDCFRLCDLTEESWDQFQNDNITLCGTTISPSNIFENSYRELPMEDVIQLLNWGKHMEENNEISKKYREIESTYVHRPWTEEENNLQVQSGGLTILSNIYKRKQGPQWEAVNIVEMMKSLKEEWKFYEKYVKSINWGSEHEPIINDEGKKVLILLGEAGYGKSTNLTWLAWHLRNRNPSSWVIRCNLSDHCSSFKPFSLGSKNKAEKVITETEAMKMLYKVVCSSLQLKQEMAEICSNCLLFSDGQVSVNEDLRKQHGLSLNNSIQLLVFKEKFNAGELIFLLDGFDEIAPYYKEAVLKFLSLFAQFKGVRKLYLTSRPYGFKKQVEKSFNDPSFFRFKPLSQQDKEFMLYKMMKEKWHNGKIDNEEIADFYHSLCITLIGSLGRMSDIPLNLMMVVDILGDRAYHNENMKVNFSSNAFMMNLLEAISDMSMASFTVEEFVKVKIRHLLYDKNGADKNVTDKPLEIEKFEKAIEEAKLLHGMLALYVFFGESELAVILSPNEMRQAEDFMKKLHEGSEKTGIIHFNHDGRIEFIHRTFVEYLAAWWIIQRQTKGYEQDRINMSNLESFWDEERKALRVNINKILVEQYPLHLAITEREWETVEAKLVEKPKSLYERDDGGRTALHLFALYFDVKRNWAYFLPDFIESDIINVKEKILDWTALDYAFHKDKPEFIFYLLHNGASINKDFLKKLVTSAGKDQICKAAKFARYVMVYLSRDAFVYEPHDVCKQMKQFCNEVIAYSVNETSANFGRIFDPDYKKKGEPNGKTTVEDVIEDDSVSLLESVVQRGVTGKRFIRVLKILYSSVELERGFVLKYFKTDEPFILQSDNLWRRITVSVFRNYKHEFVYLFDLYCLRFKIKDFQPCSIPSTQSDSFDFSIHSEVADCIIDYLKSDAIEKACNIINNIRWAKLGISSEIVIDENILSLLVICVATVRPPMLSYLIESCKLNLCARFVFFIAMITNSLFLKIADKTAIKPNNAYECLLNLTSNISDVEANKMLRIAITFNLFEFSKCLIQRYNIDFQAVDELKCWNVFHLCVSHERSSWLQEIVNYNCSASYIDGDRADLFRYMLAKEKDMDFFGICDEKGRSILHLAMENGLVDVVRYILSHKLGRKNFDEIENLKIDAIPNITFCCRAINEISKSLEEENYKGTNELCKLTNQIGKILLTNREELHESNRSPLILQEDANELYEIAIKCRSLSLMYYLYRDFYNAIPPLIYDADWLACIAKSLSSAFLDVTKWLLNPNDVNKHANLYEIVEKCDAEEYDLTSVDLKELVQQVELKLSVDRSVDEVCKMKLLVLSVCLKRQSMIVYLCENMEVNIDWKLLNDIMVIAHSSYCYEPGTKYHKSCAFDWSDFEPIYKYLFERTSNLDETDADGGNVLHLAAQSGYGCMAKFLIKHNMVNVTTTNEQNGWNIFHYYASRKSSLDCCDTKNYTLLTCVTKVVLEITSDDFSPSSFTEIQKNKIKDLCFMINSGRKNVIHVAIEAGNIGTAIYIIKYYLGIDNINEHKIRNSDECSRFKECYNELNQIAEQLSYNASYDFLLRSLAKLIDNFSLETIQHITEQGNVEGHIIEDACRVAIKCRSITTLEHMVIAYADQMSKALARSTSNELVACLMECIRQNKTSVFKVLFGHYRTLQGIQPSVEVEFEKEENDNADEATIEERIILWSIIDQFTEDGNMNRDYLVLLVLSVAYGRLTMARYLVEIMLVVDKSLILTIMIMLEKLWDQNCKVASLVYEYLASRCEGKPNLLHLCIQAGCWTMLEYLLNEKKLNPNETESENGWNAGHYCVSELASDANSENAFKVFKLLMETRNMNCFDVYDRNGRSVLHLALENGHSRVAKYIINHRLGIKDDKQPCMEWELVNKEKHLNELENILKSLSENVPQQNRQVVQDILVTLVSSLADETSTNFGRKDPSSKQDNERIEQTIIEDVIGEDSVWMLESIIQQEDDKEHIFEMIRRSYFELALENKSMFVLKYFMANDPSILKNEYLWKCSLYAALKDYKIEFKYFFDLYCSQFKIEDFEPCLIQSNEACYFIDYFKPDTINKIHDIINNMSWELGIMTDIVINKSILSLFVICVATVRPSMLKYLIESCKLNLCAGFVYFLAMLTNHLFSKIQPWTRLKHNKVYECLLNLASNISDVEANKMLRLAIASNLFEFSKCLIERYNIDIQAGDGLKGWNVFHLCVTSQYSFWVEAITYGDTRATFLDGHNDLFLYMVKREKGVDFFGSCDKKGRSILHLAMEYEQKDIAWYILKLKLGVHISEIRNLSVDAIPNIIFCYRAINEISKSLVDKFPCYFLQYVLAKQIVKILLSIREEFKDKNEGRLLLQKDAKQLFEIAIKCRSLFLMYYLYREFPKAIPPWIYDVDWLACTARSLHSKHFLDVTKWLLNLNHVDEMPDLYEIVEKCDNEDHDLRLVNLEKLVEQVETKRSTRRSVEDESKLKLLALAVCLKRESMIMYLCENLEVNIDWKLLIDIMVIAHSSYCYEPGTKYHKSCAFDWSDFEPIYKYLFERTSNLDETDAEGGNVLHLAAQSGYGCMAKFLIKHNMVNVMTINEQNGWNIFHYYASKKVYWNCCDTENNDLMACITKRVLEITSDAITIADLTESRRNTIKELCFNSNGGKKSVIRVAVEAGNIGTAILIIMFRLGIINIDKHKIRNSDEFSRFRECYDELSQVAEQLPFHASYDFLLRRLAKVINKFSRETAQHITEQGNVEGHIIEDACRVGIKCRSITTLEHLIIAYADQMSQALARSTSNELVACLMECIRQNKTSLFKVLFGHYRTLQGIQPSVEVEFEKEENDNADEATIEERKILWSIIDQFTKDGNMNRDYLVLLVLSVAYGRLTMARYLVEIMLVVDKSLIVTIMIMLEKLWDQNCKVASLVYEYLASRCEGKPNLLHLCIQAGCWTMLEYLLNETKLNPNEIESENGWNAGHYCISAPATDANSENAFKAFKLLMETRNMNCFDVYDRNGRSVLHLALENGHSRVVKYIINHRLGVEDYEGPWKEWDLEAIGKHINELQKIMDQLPADILSVLQEILEKTTDRKIVLTTYKDLFTKPS